MLYCFCRLSAISFGVILPNTFPFSPAFTGNFNKIPSICLAVFFASSFSTSFLCSWEDFLDCRLARFPLSAGTAKFLGNR